MELNIISSQIFTGSLVFIDRNGKKAAGKTKADFIARLGVTVPQLRALIVQKPFDLFVSQKGNDYIGINANKTYNGVARKNIQFFALHKSMLDKIVETAKKSIEEYEKFAHL